MTDAVVRRLLIDLQAPIERHWCDGDAFRTALFNALSMSFPVGEQFFLDSVRNGFKALPAERQEPFRETVQVFIGQEATHRHLHGLFNQHLERQGLVNHWGPRAQSRLKLLAGADVRHALAITAANEHFTAILADWLLEHPQAVASRDERLSTLWLWHSAEESEHKATAFDLYGALGGNTDWRLKWFRRITWVFIADLTRQTLHNLWRDGSLFRPSTWRSAARTLFGRDGLVRKTRAPWRAYLRASFHPNDLHTARAAHWLSEHAQRYTPVKPVTA